MANKDKCKEKDIIRVCSRHGFESRFCKKKILNCKKKNG